MRIFVAGAGAWGTALAMLLEENGHAVTLWTRNAEKAREIDVTRQNPALAGVTLPAGIRVTAELAEAEDAELVLYAVPSFALRETAQAIAPHLPSEAVLVSATKGIERSTNARMTEIIAEYAGMGRPIVALSGPTHAEEVSRRMATGCVLSSRDLEAAKRVRAAFMNDVFRIYINDDMVGVELCGAFKNVVALGAGILRGMGAGDNLRAMYLTRSISEISSLSILLGGRRETCFGLAGVGDLIVTCFSEHSRNQRAGLYIGQGETVEEALRHVGAAVEGYYAADSIEHLARELRIDMPICSAIYRVLYKGHSAAKEIAPLMRRAGFSEFRQ